MIVKLKALRMLVYDAYQPSGMETWPWELLDHSVDAISHVEGIQFYYGGLNKGSYKISKSVHAKGSHRRRSSIVEAVSRYKENFQNEYLSSRIRKQQSRRKVRKIYAMSHDSGMIARSGMETTLVDLESLPSLLTHQREAIELISNKKHVPH